MTELDTTTGDESVARRQLLRRGAVLAGTAVGAVAVGVAGAQPAAANDDDVLKLGGTFAGTKKTSLIISSSDAALELSSAKGAALRLLPVGDDFPGELKSGEVVAVTDGLLVGAADEDETYTSLVATQADLNVRSFVYPVVPPQRLLDTRLPASRSAGIVSTGGAGLDSSGRIKAGGYVDVYVERADGDHYLDAAFLNVTTTGSTASGYMTAYPPGAKPISSTLNYAKGATLANSSLTAVGVDQVDGSRFVVRVYSSAPAHLILDLVGVLSADVPGPAASSAAVRRSKMAARRPSARSTRKRLRPTSR